MRHNHELVPQIGAFSNPITSIGGPMASEVGESGTTSSISRDMTPDLEEVVAGLDDLLDRLRHFS